MTLRLAAIVALLLGFWVAAVSCDNRNIGPTHSCFTSVYNQTAAVDVVEEIDLVFVVDNSKSMTEEQEKLRREITKLMRVLASGDRNPDDGVTVGQDFRPINSLHVMSLTTDMGTAPFPETCQESLPLGQDGIANQFGVVQRGCNPLYPFYQEFEAGQDPIPFAFDTACVATPGSTGCVVEQPLDSLLKSLTPSSDTTIPFRATDGSFVTGTGHGDVLHEGFLREDALLVVVILTDEDDCSVRDPELFRDDSSEYPGLRNTKCARFPEATWPVSRYVDGLLALKDPSRVIVEIIAGIPEAVEGQSPSFQQLLESEAMQIRFRQDRDELAPSCESAGGRAFPARRLIEFSSALNNNGIVAGAHSICAESYAPALDDVVEKIAIALQTACIPRRLIPNENGAFPCRVVESLYDTDCAELPGRVALELEEGSEFTSRCAIQEVSDPSTESGWALQVRDEGQCKQRIVFSQDAQPKERGLLALECTQPVYPQNAFAEIGSDCSEDSDVCRQGRGQLFCEARTRTCQRACELENNCDPGYECSDVMGFGQKVCVNPLCYP